MWCGCLKNNNQVQGNDLLSSQRSNGGRAQRPSVRKQGRGGDDLLEMNRRRESEMGGEHMDDEFRDSYNIRYDTEKGQHQSSILENGHDQIIDSNERAIQEFMRSPKGNERGTRRSTISQNPEGRVSMSRQAQIGSVRRSPIHVTKSYQMLCGRCRRRFVKIMIVEMNPEQDHQTVFDIQAFFNSTQNHEHECPFCFQKAQIILSEQMLVGDNTQLDYSRTVDANESKRNTSLFPNVMSTATTSNDRNQAASSSQASQALSQLGFAQPTTNTNGASDEQHTSVIDEGYEAKPQLLYTKFQRLRNTTKLARVILVDELPPITSSSPGKSNPDRGTLHSEEEEEVALHDYGGQGQNPPNQENNNNPKALLLYPEELHEPTAAQCAEFNARVMKHLMKQKMKKNPTFYASKVCGAENSQFLRRSITPNANVRQNRASGVQQIQNQDMPLQMISNTSMMKSTGDLRNLLARQSGKPDERQSNLLASKLNQQSSAVEYQNS